eukprot:263679-Hanusia_phi.AAC.3
MDQARCLRKSAGQKQQASRISLTINERFFASNAPRTIFQYFGLSVKLALIRSTIVSCSFDATRNLTRMLYVTYTPCSSSTL